MWKKDLVDCLEKSTVAHPRIGEALAIKEQNLPKWIYKYRSVCQNHLSNLQNGTVHLSPPETYNDPYDCWLTLPDGLMAKLVEKMAVDELVTRLSLESFVSQGEINDARKSREPIGAIIALIPEAIGGPVHAQSYSARATEWAKSVVSAIEAWRGMMELSSFSSINNSLLMWGHYSENHKGFCIEYDLEGLKPDHPFRKDLYPVVYSDQIFDLAPYAHALTGPERGDSKDVYPLLCVIHKFIGWEYEKEWRVVKVTGVKTSGRDLSAPTPSRIFLGSRFDTSAPAGKELLAICEKKRIQLYQMRLAKDKFELLPQPFVPD